ncbi:MAG: hypothetical protein SGBAC_005840 [Bacillariaceae sp.]
MTKSTIQTPLNIDIESAVSKLLVRAVHRIAPDDEETVGSMASKQPKQQRCHKSKAGSTRAKKGSFTDKNKRLLQKSLDRELVMSKSTPYYSFKHRPLPAPPMFPRLRAGETFARVRHATQLAECSTISDDDAQDF